MYGIVTIINSAVLHILKLLKNISEMLSPQKKMVCEVKDILTNLIAVIISQYMCIKYHVVHLKLAYVYNLNQAGRKIKINQ